MCSKIPGQRWSGIFSSTGKLSEQGRRTEDEKDFKASVRKDHIGRTGGIVSGDMGDSARGGSEKSFPTDGTFDRFVQSDRRRSDLSAVRQIKTRQGAAEQA